MTVALRSKTKLQDSRIKPYSKDFLDGIGESMDSLRKDAVQIFGDAPPLVDALKGSWTKGGGVKFDVSIFRGEHEDLVWIHRVKTWPL
jgi:hypothetical protein